MGRCALHLLNHDPLIWFCIFPWWANIPEIKISCGAPIKNSLLTWELGTPVLPHAPEKGEKNHACIGLSGQTCKQRWFLRESLRTKRQIHPAFCQNIEQSLSKLWLCPQSYSLCSALDNTHKCLHGFIVHFHHCNLCIFPLLCLQQQLVVLMPE